MREDKADIVSPICLNEASQLGNHGKGKLTPLIRGWI